jgi:membrane-bound lytic murein transglycosylase F
MIQRIPLIVLFALVMLIGCTPSSESIARRTAIDTAAGEDVRPAPQPRQQSGEDTLEAPERERVFRFGKAIKHYAAEYGFDWRLILAVVKQESRFDTHAESDRGASGLMQLMPVTQREMAHLLDVQNESHPSTNIRIGVFYLRRLYGVFNGASPSDRLRLALASYNGGLGRIYDAQEIAAYLGDNPEKWQAVKDALPLLSKRYASLHSHIWPDERPRSGWFGGSRETIAYVDSVMANYRAYQHDVRE